MALGTSQNLIPALYGPRGQAYISALNHNSDTGSYQAATTPSEERVVLPHREDADRYDPQHNQSVDEHTRQQDQIKQLRAQGQ